MDGLFIACAISFFLVGLLAGWAFRGIWTNRIPAHLQCRECSTLLFSFPPAKCPYCGSVKGYILKTGKANEI